MLPWNGLGTNLARETGWLIKKTRAGVVHEKNVCYRYYVMKKCFMR